LSLRTREELRQRISPSQSYLDFEHGLNKIVHSLRQALGDTGNNPRFIETVASSGYYFIPDSLQPGAKAFNRDANYSIAVLPIETAANDPEAMFLSRRITSALIDALAEIQGLRILSESTVKSYVALGVGPQQAGESMGVQAVFAGELVLHDTVLFLRTELIDVSDGTHLAGARVERMSCSGLHLDEELVKEILGQLQPMLLSFAN
jgi:TolB-like protein